MKKKYCKKEENPNVAIFPILKNRIHKIQEIVPITDIANTPLIFVTFFARSQMKINDAQI